MTEVGSEPLGSQRTCSLCRFFPVYRGAENQEATHSSRGEGKTMNERLKREVQSVFILSNWGEEEEEEE